MMKREPKLYQLTDKKFEAFSHIDSSGEIHCVAADNVPMLMWPDGRWCLPANVFLQKLYSRGLSRRDRGGSLLTYAVQLSHLIRFCARNRIEFIDLSNSQFSFFIKSLVGEKDPITGLAVRSTNSVISIGRVCLEFLASVEDLYNEKGFVGAQGRIKAKLNSSVANPYRTGSLPTKFTYWEHDAFPKPSPLRKRLPVSSDDISKLKEAVLKVSNESLYLRKRRYVMLRLLEITGARRFEIANITVDSILEAATMPNPRIKIYTAKRSDEHYRWIPIARSDLNFLLEFISVNRRRILKKLRLDPADGGPILISGTTGKRLATNTITQEISMLREAAQIKGQLCAHMFRHRFITKLFVALIEQHKISNPDHFRQGLLDTETFKQVVQEWTGHMRKDSVDRYISLAFSEVTSFTKTFDLVKANSAVASAKNYLQEIQDELAAGHSSKDILGKLKDLIASLDADLKDSPAQRFVDQP